jgi:hypothetical protein
MFTVFQIPVGGDRAVSVEHISDLVAARKRAAWIPMLNPKMLGGINVGKFDVGNLPMITDEAWGKNGRMFTSKNMG